LIRATPRLKQLHIPLPIPRLYKWGLAETFDFVPPPRTTLLGVFICKDSEGKGSCREKEYFNINAVLSVYRTPGAKPEPKDKVYFFRTLLLEKNAVIFPAKPFTEENIYGLYQFSLC